jgi:general secretion pathway protein E
VITESDEQSARQSLETILPEQLNSQLVRKLPLEFLKQQCAIPVVLKDKSVVIAMADPLNIEAYDAILTTLGQPCARVSCPADEIAHAISRCYYQSTTGENDPDHQAISDADDDGTFVRTHAEDLLNIANKGPVVKLVNKIFFQAVQSRASDIHIEPYENYVRVRLRIDGVLREVFSLPKQNIAALTSRLKIMANLNIAERRLPQDGVSRIKIAQELVDIRVSVIPTSAGERIVLRLLDKGDSDLTLEKIGFTPNILDHFRNLIKTPHGIILLTGPTGSGKTTTLYGVLNELNSQERNILTVEDPIEYQLEGIGQMQVMPKIGLTFAKCLRHILRQDPDTIMIGEIRDIETAQIAIQASLTGHLVLSTLHTNDSASAITRLIDMGVEPYLISSSVIAVIAQRLVRVICPQCSKPLPREQAALQINGLQEMADSNTVLYEGHGCKNCFETGYFGRTAIFELLEINETIKPLITKRQPSHVIKQAALENGMITLRNNGLQKALAGETSLDEVCRVTQDSM